LSWLEDGHDWNLFAQVDEGLPRRLGRRRRPARWDVTPPAESEREESRRVRAQEQAKSEVARRTAVRELKWFFVEARGAVPTAGEAPATVRGAAQTIAVWLRAVPPGRREVLARYHAYDAKRWPRELTRIYGKLAGVIVHNRCAWVAHGSTVTEELEKGVLASLTEEARTKGWISRRASAARFELSCAVDAYVEARGDQRTVVPRATQGRRPAAAVGRGAS
jgi:hypothetical protein